MSAPHTWQVRSLLRTVDPQAMARRAGDRLLQLAAGLSPDDHVSLRLISDGNGTVDFLVEATGVPDSEITEWVFEDVAGLERVRRRRGRNWSQVTELVPRARLRHLDPLGELDPLIERPDGTRVVWPTLLPNDGMDLLQAMRRIEVEVRLHLAPLNEIATQLALHEVRDAVQVEDPFSRALYQGIPVAARLLIGHRRGLSPRLRSALLDRGVGLALVSLEVTAPDTVAAWRGERDSMLSAGLPFGAAQCLTVVPTAGSGVGVCGIPVRSAVARPVPVDEGVCREGLRLGSALSNSGQLREVRVSPEDLLLHTQLMGSTGSGKSTLLAALAGQCRTAGIGITVLDPHGQLVDRILQEAPAGTTLDVLLVRSDDQAHPIPVNPLAGPNPELMIDTLVQVFRELHDPRDQGFMGPVWERWFGLLLAAQRVLLGDRANLALIPSMVSSKDVLNSVTREVEQHDRTLARDLRTLFNRREEEYNEHVTWVVSKFQRMVGSPTMRGILGSGRDAVDVVRVLDQRQTLLIDLGSNTVGTLSAQLLGEMWLAKHWEALALRARPEEPHLLFIDEAHLFASGLLPRILTQARKYGVGVVLAHQNLDQLTGSLREAVISSTNNVVVFRTGIQEAVTALARLGSWQGGALTRLQRLTAAASLNVGSGFTEPFTLQVDHNQRKVPTVVEAPAEVQRRSGEQYGLPDPQEAVLTCDSLIKERKDPERRETSFLEEWIATHRTKT